MVGPVARCCEARILSRNPRPKRVDFKTLGGETEKFAVIVKAQAPSQTGARELDGAHRLKKGRLTSRGWGAQRKETTEQRADSHAVDGKHISYANSGTAAISKEG